jgi:uncharacterized membrane protein YkoI
MKLAPVLFALIAAFISTGAGAVDGNGKAYGHERGNSGATSNGDDPGSGETAPGVSVYSPEGLVTIGADQNIALSAVTSGEALPLDRIEPIAIRQWGGRLIDAHLIRVNGTLLYRLTMVSDAGVSRRVYYDARTGAPVSIR